MTETMLREVRAHATSTRTRALWALGGAVLLAACAAPPTQRLAAIVRVESDPGRPLQGAQVMFEGQTLGRSDERGLLTLELRGPPGEQVALEVRCPAGHRTLKPTLMVTLRANSDPTRRPEYRAECRPELRTLVVAIRAQNAPGVPVLHLGKEVARTDARGAAHTRLRLHPNESVELRLDTHAADHRRLRPKSPGFSYTMPDRDEVVLFDQPFALEKKQPRPRRIDAPELPVRL